MNNVVDWEEFWNKFDDLDEMIEEEFQNDMAVKFGENHHYYFSDEERWKRQQQIIQKLVTEELAK